MGELSLVTMVMSYRIGRVILSSDSDVMEDWESYP